MKNIDLQLTESHIALITEFNISNVAFIGVLYFPFSIAILFYHQPNTVYSYILTQLQNIFGENKFHHENTIYSLKVLRTFYKDF